MLPSSRAVSDWAFDEVIQAASVAPRSDAIRLPVPVALEERRIYLYLEGKFSAAAAYRLEAVLRAYRSGALVGTFPAKIADFTGLPDANQSIPSLFNGGGSPVGDSVVLQLAQGFTSTLTAVVHPLRINADIDLVTLSVERVVGSTIQGWRAFLGVLSTRY